MIAEDPSCRKLRDPVAHVYTVLPINSPRQQVYKATLRVSLEWSVGRAGDPSQLTTLGGIRLQWFTKALAGSMTITARVVKYRPYEVY